MDDLLKRFSIFQIEENGIGALFDDKADTFIISRLKEVSRTGISHAQLNQLLVLSHEAPMSLGFFKYYWLHFPTKHTYEIPKIEPFKVEWASRSDIESLDHLYWGFYRIFLDGIYWFGNVRTAYRYLRKLNFTGIEDFFAARRFNTVAFSARGPILPLENIARDDRYLISEMACKSYESLGGQPAHIAEALRHALAAFQEKGGTSITIQELLKNNLDPAVVNRQGEFMFSADDVLLDQVSTPADIDEKLGHLTKRFDNARNAALKNTERYLSAVGDLDVYVATSMRTRDDFRSMATFCEQVFGHQLIQDLNIRYFDPTLSAAAGHEDKGLIECLMVKCAKILIYCASEKDSYGKDAEAAMALSLGKPVIVYCDLETRKRFFRDIHPLTRLIRVDNGVAVGSMVTNSVDTVVKLISKMLRNEMQYKLDKKENRSIRVLDSETDSVVRIQSSDRLLSETFWNHYNETWN
jgi:hypothetical protein